MQRLSKSELCILLDRACQELIHARPGSPGYYAALTSNENIAKVQNQRLIESWRNALRPQTGVLPRGRLATKFFRDTAAHDGQQAAGYALMGCTGSDM